MRTTPTDSLFAADVQAVETALDRIGYMAMTGGTTADNVEAIRVPAYRALRGIVVKHHALVAERDEANRTLIFEREASNKLYQEALASREEMAVSMDATEATLRELRAERDEARRELDETVEAYHARLREKSAAEREVVIVREMQAEWFINEAKRCRALGMPIACCDEWPECSHVSAWVESHPLAPSATGGDS